MAVVALVTVVAIMAMAVVIPRGVQREEAGYARLGRGLVFDDEIAAQQRMRIRRNQGSGEGVRGSRLFWGSEGLSGAGPSGCGNRIGVRRAKGSGKQRDQGSEGAMEDKEDGGPRLFLHQIIGFAPAHFALAPAPAQPVF